MSSEATATDERLVLVSSALKAYEDFPKEKIVFQVLAQKDTYYKGFFCIHSSWRERYLH